jgi:hypothetical protein
MLSKGNANEMVITTPPERAPFPFPTTFFVQRANSNMGSVKYRDDWSKTASASCLGFCLQMFLFGELFERKLRADC